MANKKRKTKRFRVTKKMMILGSIAVALLLYFSITSVLAIMDTNRKTQKLEQSAVLLDELKTNFEQTGLDISLFRDEYCWRTGEKFAEGTRYCEQRLIAVGKNKTTDIQVEESSILAPLVENLFFTTIPEENFNIYEKQGYIHSATSFSKHSTDMTECSLVYNAYDESRTYDDLANNVYAFDIICSEYIQTKDIYPMKARYSWDTYMTKQWSL